MRRLALALGALVALAAAGCGGGGAATTSVSFSGPALQPPLRAPAFSLRDAHGGRMSLAAQRGKVVLVTFLYTHCVDVCPIIAANLNTVLRELGSARADARVIAISVDPHGDTRAAVRRYARVRHLLPQFHYLIGSARALRPVWHAWHVGVDPRNLDKVDHSAYVALVDQQGNERVIYPANVTPDVVLHDVRQLLS